MTFNRYDVAITLFPFTDKRGQKLRPVVILTDDAFHVETGEVIAAMVTSAGFTQRSTDVPIGDLIQAGLRTPCVMRMKILTLQATRLAGRVGALALADRNAIAKQLRTVFPA